MDKLIDMKQVNNLNATINSPTTTTTTTTTATRKLIQARLPFQPVRRTNASSIITTTTTTTLTSTTKESPNLNHNENESGKNKSETIIEIDDDSNEKSSLSNKKHIKTVEPGINAAGIKRKRNLLSPSISDTSQFKEDVNDDDDDDLIMICDDDDDDRNNKSDNPLETINTTTNDKEPILADNSIIKSQKKHKKKPKPFKKLHIKLPLPKKRKLSENIQQQQQQTVITDEIPEKKTKQDAGDDDDEQQHDDVIPIIDLSSEEMNKSQFTSNAQMFSNQNNDIQLQTDEKIELSQSNNSSVGSNHADNGDEDDHKGTENNQNNDNINKSINKDKVNDEIDKIEDKHKDNDKGNNNDDEEEDKTTNDTDNNNDDDPVEDDGDDDDHQKVIISELDSESAIVDIEVSTPKCIIRLANTDELNVTARKLTPKQQRHREEVEKRARDKQLAKEERDRKLQEEKELRQRERDENLRQRRKEKEDREEAKRREREEKEEQRRKEKDEREQKRLAEVAAKNEERRKRQEDEQRKQKEEAELKAKKKASEVITKFFVPTAKLPTIGNGIGISGSTNTLLSTMTNNNNNSSTAIGTINAAAAVMSGAPTSAAAASSTVSTTAPSTSLLLLSSVNSNLSSSTIGADGINVIGSDEHNINNNVVTQIQTNFMPFCIKGDMKLAPIIRRTLTDCERNELEKLFCLNSNDNDLHLHRPLYFESIKMNCHIPIKTGKQKSNTADDDDDDDDEDCCIIDDDDSFEGARPIIEKSTACKKSSTHRAKLFQFHENQRPPYYGTWRKKSDVIRSINPFVKDTKYFDYEIDSDDEWEEEEPGESLHGSDDEKDKRDDDGGGGDADDDDYDIDNEFFVPHGHLSDEELYKNKNNTTDGEDDDVVDEDDDDNSPAVQKAKLEIIQKNFVAEMKKKTEKIKPRLIGLIWVAKDGTAPILKCSTTIWNKLEMYTAMCINGNCGVRVKPTINQLGSGGDNNDKQQQQQRTMTNGTDILYTNDVYDDDDDEEGAVGQRENTLLPGGGGGGHHQKRIKISETTDIIDLIHLIHGNTNNIKFLIKEFQAYRHRKMLGTDKFQEFSNISVRNKIKELAEWRPCPDEGPFLNKYCWYMAKEKRLIYSLEHLQLPNVWTYILPLSNKSGKIKELVNGGSTTTAAINNDNKTLISSLNLMPLIQSTLNGESNGITAITGTQGSTSTVASTTTVSTAAVTTIFTSSINPNQSIIDHQSSTTNNNNNNNNNNGVNGLKKKIPILIGSLPTPPTLVGQKIPTTKIIKNNLISQYLLNPISSNKKCLIPIKSIDDDDADNNKSITDNNKSMTKSNVNVDVDEDTKMMRIKTDKQMELSSSAVVKSTKDIVIMDVDEDSTTTATATTGTTINTTTESKQTITNNIVNINNDGNENEIQDIIDVKQKQQQQQQQQPMEVDNETVMDCAIVIID